MLCIAVRLVCFKNNLLISLIHWYSLVSVLQLCIAVIFVCIFCIVLYCISAVVVCICHAIVASHVWICLLCKLPFRNSKSYEIHHRGKHTAPASNSDHSCAHCGRTFRHDRQLQLHKCRPENYASNVQKEMRQRSRRLSGSAATQYIGPTFVKVPRHDDILAVVGDIFSHSDNGDDGAVESTCVADSPSSGIGRFTDD